MLAIDTDERRRALAAELGADEVLGDQPDPADAVREATNGKGADVVLDFVGTDETHAAGLAMVASGGVYSVIGYGGTIAHPSVLMVATETSIWGNLVGSWTDLWELVQLHARGEVTLRSETFPLEQVNDVLDRLCERATSPGARSSCRSRYAWTSDPPSTTSAVPVMKLDAGEASSTTTPLSSSGWAMRPSGINERHASFSSSLGFSVTPPPMSVP